MSQKFKQKEIIPDPLHDNILVSRFINQVMEKGKKSLSRKIIYSAFEIVKEKTKKDPVEVFEKALETVSPSVEVRPQRVGGATYQVPREVSEKRALSLAMRWIIGSAKSKKGKPMREKLAEELILASRGEGEAVKKKENAHKMAAANRAFAYLAR